MPWESYVASNKERLAGSPRAPHGPPIWFSDPVAVRLVDAASTAFSANNTAAETTIASLDLPSLSLSSTGACRMTAGGTVVSATTGTVTFRVKWNDGATQTVLTSSGIAVSGSASPHRWALEVMSLGTQPTAQKHWGWLGLSNPSANTLAPAGYTGVARSTSGRNETNSITITVTAQMSAASTGFTVTRDAATLEVLSG